MRRIWRAIVPYRVRRAISDARWRLRSRASSEHEIASLRAEIESLKREIDEARRSQQRVAELMDLVENMALQSRRD